MWTVSTKSFLLVLSTRKYIKAHFQLLLTIKKRFLLPVPPRLNSYLPKTSNPTLMGEKWSHYAYYEQKCFDSTAFQKHFHSVWQVQCYYFDESWQPLLNLSLVRFPCFILSYVYSFIFLMLFGKYYIENRLVYPPTESLAILFA